MIAQGYSPIQRKQFFNTLWHYWLPRKISGMLWLVVAEGLPVGDWRRRIGQDGVCTLCQGGVMQTTAHALFDCPGVTIAWTLLRRIRSIAGAAPSFLTWESVLYGHLGRPCPAGREQAADDTIWKTAKPCVINQETPWLIIRSALLWSLWCQHCEYDLRSGLFHVGVAIFRSWQITVQVGMGAWRELQRYKRKRASEAHATMEQRFMEIWTVGDLFCSDRGGTPAWHPAPSPEYLPRDYSDWLSHTRIDRATNRGATPNQQDPSHSDSRRGTSNVSSPPTPREWALAVTPLNVRPGVEEAEQLAETIINQLVDSLVNEADQGTGLPDDLQSSEELNTQALFWASPP